MLPVVEVAPQYLTALFLQLQRGVRWADLEDLSELLGITEMQLFSMVVYARCVVVSEYRLHQISECVTY